MDDTAKDVRRKVLEIQVKEVGALHRLAELVKVISPILKDKGMPTVACQVDAILFELDALQADKFSLVESNREGVLQLLLDSLGGD